MPGALPGLSNVPGEKLAPLRITDIRTILTAPAGIRLVVVKVLTSEPGLYGLGCATFTQRARVVETAVDRYLKPFLIGKDPTRIEDIWQSCFVSSYWRNGPVLNNAISGVDMALWDILGKRAGLPLYQLLGGKCRTAVETYSHAAGGSFDEVTASVQKFLDQGYRYVRVQVAVPGTSTYGAPGQQAEKGAPPNARTEVWEPRGTFGSFRNCSSTCARPRRRRRTAARRSRTGSADPGHPTGQGPGALPPVLPGGSVLARGRRLLQAPAAQTSTPIAMGELFNNTNEWLPLVSDRLIDFIRVHLSQVGGLTMARKIAALCEFFRVRTAWHGPGDVSPVGHAANVHLDLVVPNFGIQEAKEFNQAEQDVFPGCPELKDGAYFANDKPGLGIDLNEELAARFPVTDDPTFDMFWGNVRRRDGTIVTP